MRSVITALLVSCTVLAALGGCKGSGANTERTVFGNQDRADPRILAGDWEGREGLVVSIRETAAGGLRIWSNADPETEYAGMLIDVGGRTIVEVPLSDEHAMDSDAAPVSLFARVWVAGDTLTSQPLRAEWLEARGSAESGIVRAPLAQGEGHVTVGDPAAMRDLLRRASADDTAWGASERYRRK